MTFSIEKTKNNIFYVGVSQSTGGTTDYNALSNKPAIDGVILTSATTKADLGLGSAFVYKGQVQTVEDLPTTGNKVGDVWNVIATEKNYVWNGTSWDNLGGFANVRTLKDLGIATSGISTKEIITQLIAKGVGAGNIVLGGVQLTDFPDSRLLNAEIIFNIMESTITGVTIYNVVLSSLSISPYCWVAGYRTDNPSADIVWIPMNIQYDTMPTASSYYEGKIVQYIGTSTATYIEGYYYKCVETATAGTYEWQQVNVQPGGSGGSYTAGTGIDITSNVISANEMVGADGTNAGTKGAVPTPAATDNTKFLRGDGTWQTVVDDASVVHIANAETITGAKTFSSTPRVSLANPNVWLIDTDVSKGTTPSATNNAWIGTIFDKNGILNKNKLAQIYTNYATNGAFDLNISCFEPTTDSTSSTTLKLGYNASKQAYTSVVAPTEDTTSSTQIDTVGARNTKLANYQPTLVSGTNIKSINETSLLGSGDITIRTYTGFPIDFVTEGTLQEVVQGMLASSGAKKMIGYMGEIGGACLPWGSGSSFCKVEFTADDALVINLINPNIPPYSWVYNSESGDFTWKKQIAQLTTMPTASNLAVGVIVQYVGETTAQYSNGYFYKCVNNSGTYSWEILSVQPGLEILQGEKDPDETTIGTLGQIYINISTTNAFMCVKTEESHHGWKKITNVLLTQGIELTPNGWNEHNQQEVDISDMNSDDTVWVSPVTTESGANEELYASYGIRALYQENEKLTFACTSVPSESIYVSITF